VRNLTGLLETAVWVYAGILSPFLIFCSYGLIQRFAWIASPRVFIPGIGLVCIYFYIHGLAGGPYYDHFLYAAIFVIGGYLATLKLGYSQVDSAVLSALTMLAIDTMWQIPSDFLWLGSLDAFRIGIATMGFNFMSIPFILYFVLKANGTIRFSIVSKAILAVFIGLSLAAWFTFGLNFIQDYFLVIPAFVFFLSLFHSSRIPTFTLRGPVPTAAPSHIPPKPAPG
jgi:hypothetical protein